MEIVFKKLYQSVDDMNDYEGTSPFEVAAQTVNVICSYDPSNTEPFYEMLKKLMGENQEISNHLKSNIKDRMVDKYNYIGESYFKGATPENDYVASEPYTVVVEENPYSYDNEGYAKLYVKCNGADSPRPVTLRKQKDGKWVLWSDAIIPLLTGIRKPAKNDPWV